jgi:hypothetical protein
VSAQIADCVRRGGGRGGHRRGGGEGIGGGRGGEGRGGEGMSASARTLWCVRADGFLPTQTVKTVRGINVDVRTVNFTV